MSLALENIQSVTSVLLALSLAYDGVLQSMPDLDTSCQLHAVPQTWCWPHQGDTKTCSRSLVILLAKDLAAIFYDHRNLCNFPASRVATLVHALALYLNCRLASLLTSVFTPPQHASPHTCRGLLINLRRTPNASLRLGTHGASSFSVGLLSPLFRLLPAVTRPTQATKLRA
eukprot:107658-Chlamydomonas_euryale.AAC.10